MLLLRVGFILSIFLFSVSGVAGSITGKVISVTDGETLTLLSENTRYKIRLVGIDAPELTQPFGQKSRQNLISLAKGEWVTVDYEKHDQYGRILGKVTKVIYTRDHSDPLLDIGLTQLRRGMAWYDWRREDDLSFEDRDTYREADGVATKYRLGLWKQTNPIAPWEFRLKKATASVFGRYYKEYSVPDREEALFSSQIEIERISNNKAHADVLMVAPTAGSSCGGHVEGIARVSGNNITFTDSNDEGETCTIVIEVTDKIASVVSDQGCLHWSGAGCAFVESVIDVPWVEGIKKVKRH